jgi:DNA polymerase III alpha subunit
MQAYLEPYEKQHRTTKNHPYTPFLYHSNYGRGGSTFETLFKRLEKYGLKNCAIVDNTLFGLPEFLKYARMYNIRPIIGARISLPSSSVHESKVFLFVKNKQGYSHLCYILTQHAFDQLDLACVQEHAQGLAVLSNSVEILRKLAPCFEDTYYLLLPYHNTPPHEFPVLAANEIFYATQKDCILYKLMCAIKKNPCEHRTGELNHLISNDMFHKIFAEHPDAIAHNKQLSMSCEFVPEKQNWIFPSVDEDLHGIIKSKMHTLGRAEQKRVEYEYKIIQETGFEPHFALVYHLKEFARSKGIGMNVRGSAASSFILYILGLSVVNPFQYNLPFERFLNPQRSEPPDIDVDIEFNQRQRLIDEIFRKFGREHVAHVSMINRFKRRARFRTTARAYGISPQEISTIYEHLEEHLVKKIYTLSEHIDEYPYYFSCHASGIVITPQPITTYTPLSPSPAGQITHFDKDGISLPGLVKIDILGVRGFPGLFLSRKDIKLNDTRVYEFISKGTTLGCFQIESPLVRQFIQKIQPKSIMDIANAIAVIRPGPARGGMKERFLKRLKGEENVEYPHIKLRAALQDTLGIPIYQEQILQIAHDFAHFSLSDGDMLRRAMTKERNTQRMKKLADLFYDKAQHIGHSKKEIDAVWKRICAFSSFGFNKAHATTYGTLAYLSAYQKYYEPLDFFCRLINHKGGYYTTYAYINEARRQGLTILAPDVNKSKSEFTIYNKDILTGLNEIKNLSSSTITRITQNQPFTNAQEFFYCVRPSIDEGISLIKAGALDQFNCTWPTLYFLLLLSKTNKNTPPVLGEKIPDFTDFSLSAKLQDQFHTMDFLPGHHVLEVFYPQRRVRIAGLPTGKKCEIIGTPIVRSVIRTKNGKPMSFTTIDDETGTLEMIVFPDRYKPHLSGIIMQAQGTVRDNTFIVDNYTTLPISS